MNRPFLFLSGEFTATMPIVFARSKWSHTMRAKKLIVKNEEIQREGIHENLKGFIFYADVESEEIKLNNLNFIINNNIPCYPNPKILLNLIDRHHVMKLCLEQNFIDHVVIQGKYEEKPRLPFPFVLKTGNLHCGEGKFLIQKEEEIPEWDGIATLEPFFIGDSIRILWIDQNCFMIKVENPDSWIKNTQGAEVSLIKEIPQHLLEHSKKVKNYFGLEIAGIDYIVEPKNNKFHFLEYNQFPGIGIDDEVIAISRRFFVQKMEQVEKEAECFQKSK